MAPQPPETTATAPRPSRKWLLDQYWRSAFAILVGAIPVVALLGATKTDVLGIGGYIVITLAAWGLSRRSAPVGARLHLLAMLPYWTWYSALEGGVPARLNAGVAEWAVLLVFPIVTLVTIEGIRGAVAGVALGVALLAWRWPETTQILVGTFLVVMAAMIGMVFRRLAVSLDDANARVRHMAFHDALTELPNRRELHDRAARVLVEGERAALLFIDLNRFKTVNDALGHHVGDQLLQEIAGRLRDAIDPDQLVARIGGDEFAMLLHGVDDPMQARTIALDAITRIREPVELAGRVLHVSASVGIALYPIHGEDIGELMQAADLAMYRAKAVDDRVAIHGDDGDEAPHSRFELEVDLWQAAKRDELVLKYQPVLELGSGDVVGAEALVRWRHPDSGLVPPADFIALAEESGAVVEIDCWVAERALEQLASWLQEGFAGTISINASARTLGDDRYGETLAAALERTGVAADRVIVEVTESAAMKDPDRVRARLEALTALGLSVALDDFGMGYSSLAYLKELPASRIKIDRAFIRGIGHHERDEQVVELVLKIADSFDMEVVAEGVEDAAQATWLQDRGCPLVQGFHYGRPSSPDGVLALAQRTSPSSGTTPTSRTVTTQGAQQAS